MAQVLHGGGERFRRQAAPVDLGDEPGRQARRRGGHDGAKGCGGSGAFADAGGAEDDIDLYLCWFAALQDVLDGSRGPAVGDLHGGQGGRREVVAGCGFDVAQYGRVDLDVPGEDLPNGVAGRKTRPSLGQQPAETLPSWSRLGIHRRDPFASNVRFVCHRSTCRSL